MNWVKLKNIKEKLGIVAGILLMVFGVGLFGAIKYTVKYMSRANNAINGFELLVKEVDTLKIQMKLVQNKIIDYDLIKQNTIYLLEDNEILSGLLRANIEKLDVLDYGTFLVLYDDVQEKNVRRLVEVKMRKSITSGDLYVFVPYGKILGIPITKKFAAKWHEDEKKYYYIDKQGAVHLMYVVDIENTIQK